MNDIVKRENPKEVIPAFQANWDPFNALADWEKFCQKSYFGNAVQSLVSCDLNAIHAGVLKNTPVESRFSAEDITLQAFFISFNEIFYESKRIIDSIGWIAESDLIDFPDLIGGRGSESENFMETMITVLYWFQNLINRYEQQGFQPRDKFGEFSEVGISRQDIVMHISRQMKSFGNFSIQFYQADGYGTMDFLFDFESGTTNVCMKDFVMGGEYGHMWFSEFLDREKPFLQNKKLHFLYPMGYRCFTFPLINVTEIKLELQDGSKKVYRSGTDVVDTVEKGVTSQVGGIIR